MFDKMKAFALSLEGLGYIYGAQGQMCTLAFRRQQAQQYPKQAGNILGIGAKWDGKRVWECAQLTQEVAKLGCVNLPSGATSQWTKTDWDERGTIDTLPADEFVFLYKQDKKNKNVMSHTGVYLGDGTVVDARGVEKGVLHESISAYPWTHWARPKWGSPEETRTTLRNGSKGAEVTELQLALMLRGYDLPRYGADGKFGAETETAVRAFQKANGLAVDGIAGPKTLAALENTQAVQPMYMVTIRDLSLVDAEEITAKYGGEIHTQ